MSTPEWYRRTTWSDTDRNEFNARLNRSRGEGNKAQYLRIQAWHLADAGLRVEAIGLLDRLFSEFPVPFELSQAHGQKAESLAFLGRIDDAIREFRTALQCQRDFPNSVRTNAWLDFGWLIVERRMREHYSEVSQVLQEFRGDGDLGFPALEFRYAAIQSFLADDRGENVAARDFAVRALAEAAKDHSGYRYHSRLGLVGSIPKEIALRLRTLAGS
jgi:tetratricopeptide (TPR) repeat protein